MARPFATLARTDLNLLPVFLALAETRHVARAARMLGMSQPALSHALRRLREFFGDPFFVRTPTGMACTPLAESIAPAVREALAVLERNVLERGPFLPRELSRTFTVRTTDYLEALVLPSLLGSTRRASATRTERHLVVAPGGDLAGSVDRALARRKLARRVVAGTSAFMVAAWTSARSDHVLTAPSRLLDQLAGPLGLETFAPPLTMPSIQVAQVWHGRNDADPAHRWFRGLVRIAASKD